jgi:hypothetical protein
MGDYINQVFTLDVAEKYNLMNLLQYTTISIIPVVLFNKAMQKYVPPADDTKSTIEIILEILLQIIAIVVIMFFIDRMISFIPTYSDEIYAPTGPHTWGMLVFMIILLSLQSNFGQKVNILFDRLYNCFFTNTEKMEVDDEPQEHTTRGLPNTQSYILPNTNSLAAPQRVLSPKEEANLNQGKRLGEIDRNPSREQPMQLPYLTPASDAYEDNFY